MSSTTLLAWSAENRIQIDDRLHVRLTEHAVSVCSRDALIECDRTLVYIPKTAVLSIKSCFLSQYIAYVPYGHGAHLSLALALYGELLRGTRSPWFGYLQSLPRETVDIAMFWGLDNVIETQTCTCSPRGGSNPNDSSTTVVQCLSKCPSCVWSHDNQCATEWLQVTEFDREQVTLMDEIRQYYVDVVEPTFDVATTEDITVSFSGYCYAYSLVSTRAFWVDAYHGLAMVPIADAFNHTNDNHVQMESDYDVCVDCGSLAECEHDRETGMTVPSMRLPNAQHPVSHEGRPASGMDDYLEMRTVRAIAPLSEVYNTYGPLPNAVLLSRYGFILAENEYDTIRMVQKPLWTVRHLLEVGNAVTGVSTLSRVGIRNTFRPYVQGIVDKEARRGVDTAPAGVSVVEPSDESAWENMTNRLVSFFVLLAGAWRSEAAWEEEEDGLVFNPQSVHGPVSFMVCDGIGDDMVINSDGKISHTLWLFCILIALFAARTHFGASFRELMEKDEKNDQELTILKARLINVQGYVERLYHIDDDDGDGVEREEMEGAGNHGSTCPPPLPHRVPLSLKQDYESESDAFSQLGRTVRGKGAIEAGGTSITAPLGRSGPERDVFERKGPISSRPGEEGKDGNEYRPERDRFAEGERRPLKRIQLDTDEEEKDLAVMLARIVVRLCHERYRGPRVERGVGMTAAELGELVDHMPPNSRTGRALSMAMGERSIVESCACYWETVLGSTGGFIAV